MGDSFRSRSPKRPLRPPVFQPSPIHRAPHRQTPSRMLTQPTVKPASAPILLRKGAFNLCSAVVAKFYGSVAGPISGALTGAAAPISSVTVSPVPPPLSATHTLPDGSIAIPYGSIKLESVYPLTPESG